MQGLYGLLVIVTRRAPAPRITRCRKWHGVRLVEQLGIPNVLNGDGNGAQSEEYLVFDIEQ